MIGTATYGIVQERKNRKIRQMQVLLLNTENWINSTSGWHISIKLLVLYKFDIEKEKMNYNLVQLQNEMIAKIFISFFLLIMVPFSMREGAFRLSCTKF